VSGTRGASSATASPPALETALAAFVVGATPPRDLATQLEAFVAAADRAASAADAGAPSHGVLLRTLVACAQAVGSPVDLVASVAVGTEVGLRLALVLGGPDQQALDATYAACVLGGAMGAARALHLDDETTVSALGFAATQATAWDLGSGTPDGRLLGWAASSGVESALMAASGLVGPPRPLTGTHGLFALYRVTGAETPVTRELGQTWLTGSVLAGTGVSA
jgi:2-methylcitrate dehydratase PrpD